MDLESKLLIGTATLSFIHSMFPNHWAPFVLVGKSRNWTTAKSALITLGASSIHCVITISIGLLISFGSISLIPHNEHGPEIIGTVILFVLGAMLILGRVFNRHLHEHFNPETYSRGRDILFGTLLVSMMSFSPCAAILPVYIVTAAAGWSTIITLSIIFFVITSLGMTLMVIIFTNKIRQPKYRFLEENEGWVSGLILIIIGLITLKHTEHSIDLVINFLKLTLVNAWNVFMEAGPYILFGSLIGGVVYAYIRPENIAKYLGRGRIKPVIYSSLIGVPLPLCSCGVIPTGIALRKMGATRGATTAFLITTPESGIDSIAVTYALLDPIFTVFRPVAAFITGVTAGLIEVFFGEDSNKTGNTNRHNSKDTHTCCPEDINQENKGRSTTPEPDSVKPESSRFRTAITYGLGDFLKDISGWIVLGFLIAGFITAIIPDKAIEQSLGGGLGSMLLMLLFSAPLYICASATTPLAAALLLKGASPGAALVLLLAGPATNAAGITLLLKFIGKRSVAIYLASIGIMSVFLGTVLNFVYKYFEIDTKVSVGTARHFLPHDLKYWASIVLVILITYHIVSDLIKNAKSTPHEHCAD